MTTKKTRIVYWTATIIIFLMEGLMPALTGNTDLAKEGVRHLGYPDYFRVMLNIFKIVGAIVLIAPFIGARMKEWAYTGLGITMISAFISHWAVDGLHALTFMPLAFLLILVVSYICYHKLKQWQHQSSNTALAI